MILAFESSGIYPLNKEWLEIESNKKLLKLGGISTLNISQDPKVQKYTNLLEKFDYHKHASQLSYLNLYSPNHHEEQVHGFELKKEIEEELQKKEEQIITTKKQSSSQNTRKRKYKDFEDCSQPRILNTDERLILLKEKLDKKKKEKTTPTKSSLKKQKHKTLTQEIEEGEINSDIEIDLPKLRNQSNEVISKIFYVPIKDHEVGSGLVDETASKDICELYLPIDFETTNWKPKKKLVEI